MSPITEFLPMGAMKAKILAASKLDGAGDIANTDIVDKPLRVFLLVSAYNGLTQAVHKLLEEPDVNCDVTVEYAANSNIYRPAIDTFQPDLIICPFLKEFVPEDIFERYTTLIIHPGIIGDRGPSSIDWAILKGAKEWGMVVVQAAKEYDAGAVWASKTFLVPEGVTKSRMYGELVTEAALVAIPEALANFRQYVSGSYTPEPVFFDEPWVVGQENALMKQADCAIQWETDTTAEIVLKISARDGQPGLLTKLGPYGENDVERSVFLYGAHAEKNKFGKPKEVLEQRAGAVLFGTVDGAVWITHMRLSKAKNLTTSPIGHSCMPHGEKLYKLPAAVVMMTQLNHGHIKEQPYDFGMVPSGTTYQDVVYQKRKDVGVVLFQFYNGAMGVDHCKRLTACLQHAKAQDTKALLVAGGGVLSNAAGYFSNGIHLNNIDFSPNPALEAWENINAIDDACKEILTCDTQMVVACICGNAGAGGIMMPLGADVVVSKSNLVFNPHYATMGLYGSEYWTYSLPRRVGLEIAERLTTECLPILSDDAVKIGMVDRVVEGSTRDVMQEALAQARFLATNWEKLCKEKRTNRNDEEMKKPLQAYRDEELSYMCDNMFSNSLGFLDLCHAFVHKSKVEEAPSRINSKQPPRQASKEFATRLKSKELVDALIKVAAAPSRITNHACPKREEVISFAKTPRHIDAVVEGAVVGSSSPKQTSKVGISVGSQFSNYTALPKTKEEPAKLQRIGMTPVQTPRETAHVTRARSLSVAMTRRPAEAPLVVQHAIGGAMDGACGRNLGMVTSINKSPVLASRDFNASSLSAPIGASQTVPTCSNLGYRYVKQPPITTLAQQPAGQLLPNVQTAPCPLSPRCQRIPVREQVPISSVPARVSPIWTSCSR